MLMNQLHYSSPLPIIFSALFSILGLFNLTMDYLILLNFSSDN